MAHRTSKPLHPTEYGDNPPLVTKRRKKHARSIRPTSRKNPDGSRSSHIMESGESDGKYKYQVLTKMVHGQKKKAYLDGEKHRNEERYMGLRKRKKQKNLLMAVGKREKIKELV